MNNEDRYWTKVLGEEGYTEMRGLIHRALRGKIDRGGFERGYLDFLEEYTRDISDGDLARIELMYDSIMKIYKRRNK